MAFETSEVPNRRAPSFRMNFFRSRGPNAHKANQAVNPGALDINALTDAIHVYTPPETRGISPTNVHGAGRDISPGGNRQFFRARTFNGSAENSSRFGYPSDTSHSMPAEFNGNAQMPRAVDHTSSRSKSPGTRLRSALGLLRKRSHPSLGRSIVSPIGERDELEQNGGPFVEPLLDIDSVEPGFMAPAPRRGQSVSSGGFEQRARPFKFGLPARSTTPRNVLTKRPPSNHIRDRPRRATIPDIGMSYHSAMGDVYSSRTNRSSETDIALDDHANDSILSHESPAIGFGAGSPAGPTGGLFPRPASLQRHWSESGSHQRESVHRLQPNSRVSYVVRRRQSAERVRPVSFGGISPSTSYVLPANPAPETLSIRSTSRVYQDSSSPQIDTSATGGTVGTPSSNRHTGTTLQAPQHEDEFLGSSAAINPSNLVHRTEYNKLATVLKQEQKLRKRLESQVAVLQEQVACLLHRHLLAATGAALLPDTREPHQLQPDPRIDRQPSREEIPTPDMTPPSTAPAMLQSTFDDFNEDTTTEYCESVSGIDDERDNEMWATPAEEIPSIESTTGGNAHTGVLSPRPPSTIGRAMSLSQLTQKTHVSPI